MSSLFCVLGSKAGSLERAGARYFLFLASSGRSRRKNCRHFLVFRCCRHFWCSKRLGCCQSVEPLSLLCLPGSKAGSLEQAGAGCFFVLAHRLRCQNVEISSLFGFEVLETYNYRHFWGVQEVRMLSKWRTVVTFMLSGLQS